MDGKTGQQTSGDGLMSASPRRILIGSIVGSFLPILILTVFRTRFDFVMDKVHYLLLHNITEFFSIMVSLSIFGVGWYSYRQSMDRHALFLSTAFLAIGLLDFMHTLANAAMPAFITANSSNKSTQFWIAARLFSSAAFLLSAYIYPARQPRWLPKRVLSRPILITAALVIPLAVFSAITFFPSGIPDTFVPGQGLTPFKVISEYLVILMLIMAAIAYWRRMAVTGDETLIYYVAAFVICMFGEVVFAGYKTVFDTYNVVGHIYKIAAFCLIYGGIFVASVQRPYLELSDANRLLDSEINERRLAQDALQRSQAELELRVEQRTNSLRESEERFSTTLSSIGDAVIATDVKGRVTFMNTIAESLTGWSLEEASQKPVADVFRIVNEHTRQEVESPVARVLREGMIVGLANHTILIRKDGTEVSIDDSGAPIRDGGGVTSGVVLVFRDITERRRAEEALRESNERFTLSMEATSDGVWDWNAQTDEVYYSPSYYRILGYEPGGFPGTLQAWKEMVHPDDLDGAVRVNMDCVVGHTETFAVEYRMRSRTGEWRWVLGRGKCITRDEHGRAIRLIGTHVDVTDHRNAEEALREARDELEVRVEERTTEVHQALESVKIERQRLYDVLDTLPVYTILLTQDYRVSFANRFFIERFGESEGRRCYEYLFNRTEPCDICETYTVMKTNAPHHWYWTGPDGRDYDIYDFPFVDSDGSRLILEMGIDITEWRRAETALQESNETIGKERKRLYDVLETLPVILAIIRPDHRVEWVNRAYREALGDNQGLLCYESQFGREKPCEECQAFIPLETGRPHQWEWTLPNGQTFDIYNFPFGGTDGLPVILEMDIDITEQRHLEEQLRQAQKMEALGTLTGGIAHDFNNILAAILGFAEMSLDDVPKESLLEKNLRYILKSSLRARDLIKQMLAFSRKTRYEVKPMSLTPLVKETAKLLRASIPTTIDIDVITSATSDTITANATNIQQIIMNLCTNASYAMRQNGGKLSITLADADIGHTPNHAGLTPGPYIELTVKDTGTGMDTGTIKRVFDPFFTTKEQGEGTGMGLSVAYGIVKSLNGEITVESEPGKGSTFRVLIPKAMAEETSEIVSAGQAPEGKERILFIDDEEPLIELGKALLERLGYKVTAVTDSVQALSLFSAEPSRFDLIITDQTMPGLTGMHLASEVFKIRPAMPILLCTGYSESIDEDTVRAAGIREFLMKPLAKKELAETVRNILDGKGSK